MARLTAARALDGRVASRRDDGGGDDEIATRLFISPTTAKTHVGRSTITLGAGDRAQPVVFADETGVVRRGWSEG